MNLKRMKTNIWAMAKKTQTRAESNDEGNIQFETLIQ